MSKDHRQLVKSVEKFKKVAEKERARLQDLAKKCERFSGLADDHPILRQFADRMSQKDRQLAEDVSWSEDFVREVEAEFAKTDEAAPRKVKANRKKAASEQA